MQSKALPTVSVIKKEEKESKLKAFISEHFASLNDAGKSSADRVFLLIARSNESPVVRALASAIAETGQPDVSLKALILLPDNQPNIWPAELAPSLDCRIAGDMRLLVPMSSSGSTSKPLGSAIACAANPPSAMRTSGMPKAARTRHSSSKPPSTASGTRVTQA